MRPKAKEPLAAPLPAGSSTNQPSAFAFGKHWILPAAILFLLTVAVYWPSFHASYIWDDDMMVENALVNGGWPGLKAIWTTTKYPDFVPLTATSFWLEAQLGGATANVRHTTNILLQGLNVVLIWLVLRRLKIPGAWITAAIFAAHPLCVSSVTWVAERKNTLSMFFYLLSFLFYLKNECQSEDSRITHHRSRWFAFVFYIAALLSKTSTVVLPVVLLLCAWWQNGRISRTTIRSTLPFFAVAFAGGVTTLIAHYFFTEKNVHYDDLLVRILASSKAVWFYLCKSFAPINLTMHYPRLEMDPRSFVSYLPGLGLVGVFAVSWRFRQGWGRGVLFGLGYFVLALAPALGIAKMTFLKFSQVADHFQFLALPGLIALVVGGVCHVAENRTVSKSTLLFTQIILLAAAVPMLAALSWQHQRIFSNAEILWRDNIEKNPKSWLAHYGLTSILEARGQFQDVESHYRQAIAIRPDYLDALSNLGVLLARQGRWSEAIDCYQRALSFDPTVAMIHFNLGTAFLAQNRFVEAVGPLSKAVELNPKFSKFHNNLASVLMKTGKQEEAFRHAREAIRLEPVNDEAQANFGLMLFQAGKTQEAIEQFESAIRLHPANVHAHYRLATVLVTVGKIDDALSHLATVVLLQPDNILAHTGMAEILRRQGKTEEAAAHLAAIKRINEIRGR